MARVELARIPSLIFYKDSVTAARRTKPPFQLVCRGRPCKLYTPEVVRCVNLGGSGTSVDWKCEADLPDSLRFGKVQVSCEGWSRPGDPYVLKDSCSLEYHLVQVPGQLRNDDSFSLDLTRYDWLTIFFWILWAGFLLLILYSFIVSYFNRDNRTRSSRPSRFQPYTRGFRSDFPGAMDDGHPRPPPYTKNPSDGVNQEWRPGFWTGAVLGGLANQIWNSRSQNNPAPRPTTWDWERPRASMFTGRRTSENNVHDRGEGTSNLGTMRRSTGFGGSNVR